LKLNKLMENWIY